MDHNPDEALIAKLMTAMGRVDAGSVGGYAFRRHVAKTDVLPLVKALLKQQAEEIALVIEAYHGAGGGPECDCEDCKVLTDLARHAREIGTKESS